MPQEETLLIVIFAAIAANLVLGFALLLVPRLRRRERRPAPDSRPQGTGQPTAAPRFDVRPPSSFIAAPGTPGAQTDPQTGLDAAATWSRWLREEDTRIRRYRRSATIVLVEIEGLDRLTERLGPEAVDRIIPPVATTLRRHGRESDRMSRLGSGRFGVLLPETTEIQAINYVERIREACDRWLAAGAVSLRLSLGWAEMNAGRSVDLAQQDAEERLNAERHRDAGRPAPPANPSQLPEA
jgi:diguanylate cyclase (GGDEF)-like protein